MDKNKELELQLTLDLIKDLRNTQGLNDIVDVLIQFLSKNFMFQYGFGYLIKSEKDNLRAQLVCNFPADEQILLSQSGEYSLFSFSNKAKNYFLSKSSASYIQDQELEKFYEAAGFLLLNEVVSLPIYSKTEQVAVLHLVKLKGHTECLTENLQSDIEFMEDLIHHIQPFIENTLQLMSVMKDDTTDVFNKKYFLLSLDKAFHRSRLNKSPLTLILVNIDGMTKINKDHGYQIGNYTINYTAALLKSSLRGFDILAKIEGDTFAILTAQNLEVSQKIAQRILEIFRSNTFTLPNNVNLSPTVSLALNDKTTQFKRSLDLYERTEEVLDQAKQDSGNKFLSLN